MHQEAWGGVEAGLLFWAGGGLPSGKPLQSGEALHTIPLTKRPVLVSINLQTTHRCDMAGLESCIPGVRKVEPEVNVALTLAITTRFFRLASFATAAPSALSSGVKCLQWPHL